MIDFVTDLLHLALSGIFLPVTASVVVAFLCRRPIREWLCEEPRKDVKRGVDEFERGRVFR